MTVGRRPHVGWEIRCDARGCPATTADLAPRSYGRSSELAVEAARRLGWISTVLDGQAFVVCPMHQSWDPRLGCWVATPLVIRARTRLERSRLTPDTPIPEQRSPR